MRQTRVEFYDSYNSRAIGKSYLATSLTAAGIDLQKTEDCFDGAGRHTFTSTSPPQAILNAIRKIGHDADFSSGKIIVIVRTQNQLEQRHHYPQFSEDEMPF